MALLDVVIILAGWFGVSLTGALAPGPLSAACVMQASRRGRIYGFLPMVGHAIVELGIIAAIILTLESIAFDNVTTALLIGFGGVVVILFGLIALRDYRIRPPDDDDNEDESKAASSAIEATAQGAIVSILSPYFIIWWFGIGLASIQTLMLEIQIAGAALFLVGALVYLVHISTDFIFGAALSVGTDRAVKVSAPGSVNWINVAIGVFQLLLGIWFVWQSLELVLLV
ncbi:MAG: LysE family transporter [Candidatus Thorarchaeota archaeon]|nr:MAG: LysE family transporter [Candidatus Thorarchaeota archaeon]